MTVLLLCLTSSVCIDVLLTDEKQPRVEGGEDEAVVPGLPEELDVGVVVQAGDGDAVGVLGGRAERLWHLLFTRAPEGGHKGQGAQEERQNRLEEGKGRRTHLLQESHHGGW